MIEFVDRELVNPRKRILRNTETNEIINVEIQDDPSNLITGGTLLNAENFNENFNELNENKVDKPTDCLQMIDQTGWYRVAKIADNDGCSLIFTVATKYNRDKPCRILASLLTTYQAGKISQLSATKIDNANITKLRLQYDSINHYYYLDVYYVGTVERFNTLIIKNENPITDKVELLTPVLVVTEYTTKHEITISY